MSQQIKPAQRVVVVGPLSLFEEGVIRLLTAEANLQVSSIPYADDAMLLQDISNARPDVVVLNEADPLDLVSTLELVKEVLQYPTISQVIVIRRDRNTMDVYEKRSNILISGSGDLSALIRNHNKGA